MTDKIQDLVMRYRNQRGDGFVPLSAKKFAWLLETETGLAITKFHIYDWSNGRYTGKRHALIRKIYERAKPESWARQFADEFIAILVEGAEPVETAPAQ